MMTTVLAPFFSIVRKSSFLKMMTRENNPRGVPRNARKTRLDATGYISRQLDGAAIYPHVWRHATLMESRKK
ncbi:MAG TPA: hypothetical protein VNA19_05350 [Pyrinomonadaceae bacterium]|nr:hypothetical protein [Pyrinomonadaceae bacterium]